MTAETLYTISNLVALAGWALLILTPRWKWSAPVVCGGIIPALLAIFYTYLLVAYSNTAKGGGFGSLAEILILFEQPHLLLTGWIHYLVFDLFVGSWELRDSQRLGINYWHVLPCMLFTLFIGPLGLLIYLTLRTVNTKKMTLAYEQ